MDLNFDIKARIDEAVRKLQQDPALLKEFQSDPVKALEKITRMDLPEEKLQPLVAGIKTKLGAAQLGDALDGLKKMF